jgi:hypothetical protein
MIVGLYVHSIKRSTNAVATRYTTLGGEFDESARDVLTAIYCGPNLSVRMRAIPVDLRPMVGFNSPGKRLEK